MFWFLIKGSGTLPPWALAAGEDGMRHSNFKFLFIKNSVDGSGLARLLAKWKNIFRFPYEMNKTKYFRLRLYDKIN